MQFQQNSHKVASMDHDGFSGVLIMLVSIVVSEKLPGQKRCDEEDDEYWIREFWGIFDIF